MCRLGRTVNPPTDRSGTGTRRTSFGRPLSPTRLRILELLEAQSTPTTLAALTNICGLHENTVRAHLEDLLRDGYLQRRRATSEGRGRPAWLWEAHRPIEPSPYAGLASALAAVLHESSADPVKDAVVAGRAWGRELAGKQQVEPLEGDRRVDQARSRIVEMLEDVGFAPEPDAANEQVLLTRCPLIEAASKHPEIVCGVHLGIIQGSFAEMGFDGAASTLVPFSAPGQCALHLRATNAEKNPE